MNKLFLKVGAIVLGAGLVVGSGVAIAAHRESFKAAEAVNYSAVETLDLTTKAASQTGYYTSTAYGNWTIVYGANNNGGWAFFKMGGKSATLAESNPCYIYSTVASAKKYDKITVHGPSGSLSKSGMSVTSWGIYVYSDSSLQTQVDYVAGSTSAITNAAWSADFFPSTGKTWSAGCYYKVSWTLANTTTTNGIVCVDTITCYEESSGAISSVDISGTTSVSSGYLELASTQLTASVTATGGLAETVTWSSSNGSVAAVDDNGLVRFMANGSANITATSTVDSTKSDTVTVSSSNLVAYSGSVDSGDFTDTSTWGGESISPFSGTLANISFADGGSAGSKLAYNKDGNMRIYSGTKLSLTCSPAYSIQYVVLKSESAYPFTSALTGTDIKSGLYGLDCFVDATAAGGQSVLLTYNGVNAYVDDLIVYYASTGSCGVSINNAITAATRGDSGTFTATTSGATHPVVTWSSSNSNVISINSSTGAYSVDFVGKTTITASLTCDEGSDSASFDVTVTGQVSISEALGICAGLGSGNQTDYKVTVSAYLIDLNPNSRDAGSENQVTLADHKVGGSGHDILVHGLTKDSKISGKAIRDFAVLNGTLTLSGYLKDYSGTYEVVSPSSFSYSDDAMTFAKSSYEALDAACETGPAAVTDEAWNALATAWASVDSYSQAKLRAAGNDYAYSDDIAHWIDRYDRIVASGKTDFMGRASSSNRINGLADNNAALIAIISSSFAVISAVALVFVLKRKKHN